MIDFFVLIILLFFIGIILQRYNLLLDNINFSKHKIYIYSKNKIPITGGLFFLISYISLNFNELDNVFKFLLILIFLAGFFSDNVKNFSPKRRLLIQILITTIFILYSNLSILDTRIDIVNYVFQNFEIISIIFTLFCILVLINGTNFIDGINLSASGYFLLIFASIFYISTQYQINLEIELLINLIKITLVILIVNFFNRTQLGDGGAYILAFVTGFFIIDFINLNKIASPYYAITLLWYPCLENLFSIIRKILVKKEVSDPDNYHLHHLIYLFFNKKNKKYSNNFSGFIILLFNSIVLSIGTYFFYDTKKQLIIIFANIFLYVLIYFTLKKKLEINFK